MLTKEDNEILCRVGPGTMMGNLLRRYWTPALLSSEVPTPDCPPVRCRLFGEDLIAFRDTDGKVGLLDNYCPHRRASLFFGRNEECGLRCVYHGWKFDVNGACVDMPSEPAESNFKDKVRITAYPTHEAGGVIWTYMGPEDKQPGFRNFFGDAFPESEWRATKIISVCNWMQGLEGNIDSSHIDYLHSGRPPGVEVKEAADQVWFDQPGYPPPGSRTPRSHSPTLEMEDTWYGFRYAGLRKTPNGYTNARVTDIILPFYTLVAPVYGPLGGDNFLVMVPIDDHSFWRLGFATKSTPVPDDPRLAALQAIIAQHGIKERNQWADNDYLIDREAQKTSTYTGISGIAQQDLAVTESMGTIGDRTKEHLGTTDRAVIRMRQKLINAAKDLANGIEPADVDPSLPWDKIRSAERNLDEGEDWRMLGTEEDPLVRQLEADAVHD